MKDQQWDSIVPDNDIGAASGEDNAVTAVLPVNAERLQQFTSILEKYKNAKSKTDARVKASENWWKLRNAMEEEKVSQIGKDGGFVSASAWLHNVVTSKHADASESYPEPNILPREEGDKADARMLSAIIPCILEQNHFAETYDNAQWRKLKTGTAIYKVVWDSTLLNGLGDIRVDELSVLNVFWQPGVADIQQSRYVFQTELVDRDILEQQYPEIKGKLNGRSLTAAQFLYDEQVDTTDRATVIEVYYKLQVGSKKVLHYCKYVDNYVLYATENQMQGEMDEFGQQISEPLAQTGLYDHGLYPFVFDALFPLEGSPCGYGYTDICINPQTAIDLMNTAFVKNAVVGAIPRWMTGQNDVQINEEEFLDTSNPIVHVPGSVSETSLREIPNHHLDGNYLAFKESLIQEMRETSGNTDSSNGSAPSGITAASAIAALQEAAGKGSRDSTKASYRAYERIVYMCIELIRQFYDIPRTFRITGEYGANEFVEYNNAGLMEQQVGVGGVDLGIRKAEFDIRVVAQKANTYTKVANNELALQFFQLGFFNPQIADQAMICLDMMDFDGKEAVMQKIQKQALMLQKLMFWLQQGMMMAQMTGNMMLAQQAMMDMQQMGMAPQMPMGMGDKPAEISDGLSKEHPFVEQARYRANNAAVAEG